MPPPLDDHHCLEFARTTAAHHDGDGGLHPDAERAHEIYQSSTLTALLDAVYDGGLTYGELEQHGDFGLGTFNALDGEMVAVDGAFFHLHADGSATPVADGERTPFAAVAFFRGDEERTIDGPRTRAQVEADLDGILPTHNLFYALRIDGTFREISTRTVARQERPYRGLTEAAAGQVEQVLHDVTGTIAGFRSPDYAQGLTVAGYHLHFIDDSRSRGGHVLDFTVDTARVRIDQDPGLHVELPETAAFFAADLDGHDDDAEIRQAEGPQAGRGSTPTP